MIVKILGALAALLLVAGLGILGVAATRPNEYTVVREAALTSPPESVFVLINDFQRWPEWSPWEKLDPAMKRTISEPSSGVDASYAWVGNDKVGEGKMIITASEPSSRVGMQLEFIKPFTSTNHTEITLEPSAEGSRVTWSMSGTNDLTAKVFGLFMDMDEMIGKDFETGLANLGALAAGPPAASPDSAAATVP